MSSRARRRAGSKTSAASKVAAPLANDVAGGDDGARNSRPSTYYQPQSPEGTDERLHPVLEEQLQAATVAAQADARSRALSGVRKDVGVRDWGTLALRALARSLGAGSRFAPTTQRVHECIVGAIGFVRAHPYMPMGAPMRPADRETHYTLFEALAYSANGTTAHVHARCFLDVLWGANINAQSPLARGEALRLLRYGDRVLRRLQPKRRGGWFVSDAPITIEELIAGPVVVPMPIELMPVATR